jgi:excisionase family DNA binding protein
LEQQKVKKRLLRIDEVAFMLGIARRTVYELIEREEIAVVLLPVKGKRIEEAELNRFIEKHRSKKYML